MLNLNNEYIELKNCVKPSISCYKLWEGGSFQIHPEEEYVYRFPCRVAFICIFDICHVLILNYKIMKMRVSLKGQSTWDNQQLRWESHDEPRFNNFHSSPSVYWVFWKSWKYCGKCLILSWVLTSWRDLWKTLNFSHLKSHFDNVIKLSGEELFEIP